MKLEDLKSYPLDILQQLFDETEPMELTPEVITVRGWLMEEMENKATPESFEAWLNDGKTKLESWR